MSLGVASRQGDLLDGLTRFCEESLAEGSVYSFLHREREHLFADEFFADLFADVGRRSVPPSVVATVMVLQRLDGLSDREAAERFTFDVRWRYACGVGGYEGDGRIGFAHTVLVDMRERLRRSTQPDRVFEASLAAARAAGLVGRRRVVDSTALYDAVATMDTITLIRSATRALLAVASAALAAELRAAISSGDTYESSAKPRIDWDDAAAREALIDSRAKDALAILAWLHDRTLDSDTERAARLLAAVVGQDIVEGDDGVFRIVHGVAADRIISTVDPDARHGRKTEAQGYDGFKGHVGIDPDSEIVTATKVTPANVGDAAAAADLLDLINPPGEPAAKDDAPSEPAGPDGAPRSDPDKPEVYGDAAYGTGPLLEKLNAAGIDPFVKVQTPVPPGGRFSKDHFDIDLEHNTVTCPHGVTVEFNCTKNGGTARFGSACTACPLRAQCTDSAAGRSVTISLYEPELQTARARQREPERQAQYQATRPKVERKIGHLMRRRHGGRRARVRGQAKVGHDFNFLAAATNLARLALLGLRYTATGWVASPA